MFFLGSDEFPQSHVVSYKIVGDSTFSDHHLVSFQSCKKHGRPSRLKMPFFNKSQKIVHCYRQLCLSHAAKARFEAKVLHRSHEILQTKLHDEPQNVVLKFETKHMRGELQTMELEKDDCRIRCD